MTSQKPTSSPTPEAGPAEELTQLRVNQQILEELRQMNASLRLILQRLDLQQGIQKKVLEGVDSTRSLLDGFTSGGASFNAYQIDQLTAAYLAVVGPLVAARLAAPGQPTDLPQMMKGAVLMAKTLTDELAAYRSQRQGLDYLEDQGAFIHDPFKESGSQS
jgi:hypothetical protein